MKIDPYNNKLRYETWKRDGKIEGVSDRNAQLIRQYLLDMESGLNVATPGARGYAQLVNIKNRLPFITRNLMFMYGEKSLTELTDSEVASFFNAMRNGDKRKSDGTQYQSVRDYVKIFKAFWHWYQRVEDAKGNAVRDITKYLDSSQPRESNFVYLSLDDVKQLTSEAKSSYRVLMWFLFDSGIRSPTELMNIRLSDIHTPADSTHLELHIRDEVSKTFGRKTKLLVCAEVLRSYMARPDVRDREFLFPICPCV